MALKRPHTDASSGNATTSTTARARANTPTHLDEETLQRIFLSAFTKLVTEREEISANFELIKETLYGTAALSKLSRPS